MMILTSETISEDFIRAIKEANLYKTRLFRILNDNAYSDIRETIEFINLVASFNTISINIAENVSEQLDAIDEEDPLRLRAMFTTAVMMLGSMPMDVIVVYQNRDQVDPLLIDLSNEIDFVMLLTESETLDYIENGIDRNAVIDNTVTEEREDDYDTSL